jgi:uncharacterized integral membrane protein
MLRTLNWLFRALLFFILFAFALNNQHVVQLKWFMGYQWEAPMVFIVLGMFALGCVAGVLAMVPSWWRHRRDARHRAHLQPEPQAPVQSGKGAPTAASTDAVSLPVELPFPPDMPAPRKPAR